MDKDLGRMADATGPSQAEPEDVSALRASVPCAWTIAGDWPYFEVEPSPGRAWSIMGTANHAVMNGEYPSKLSALESLIHDLEETRRQLSEQIARHKRARRNLSRPPPSPDTHP